MSATPPVTVACIPFLNQLSLQSKSNYVVRIVLIRDTCGAAARGEGGLRDDEGARGGGSGEFLTACGGANGPRTRADQGVCVATRGFRYANSSRVFQIPGNPWKPCENSGGVHLGNADNHGNQESGGVILGMPRGPHLDQVEWQWSQVEQIIS